HVEGFYPRRFFQDRLNLFTYLVGPLQRGSDRELHIQIEITLILLWQKAGREPRPEPARQCSEGDEQQHSESHFPDQIATPAHITFSDVLEHTVESAEERPHWSPCWRAWTQQQGCQRWA